MIRVQRSVHRWLWWLLAVVAVALLVTALEHRPDYPVADHVEAHPR